MSIALVQKNTVAASGSTSQAGAYTSNNTLGNFLVAVVGILGGNTLSSFTDTAGNTWVQAATTGTIASTETAYIMYVANCKGGANTVTATGSASSSFPQFIIAEYSGVAQTSPLDKTASAAGTGTAFSSGNTAATTQANELLIGAFAQSSGTTTTITPASGWTNEGQVRSASVPDNALLDQIVAATGTYQASGTVSSAPTAWGAAIATFKGASAPPPTGGANIVNPIIQQLQSLQKLNF